MSEEQLPRIFDRFYRARGGKASCPGSGLGLAIVAAVAATHSGEVRAAAVRPHGLAVTITIPAAVCPEDVGDAQYPDDARYPDGAQYADSAEYAGPDGAAALAAPAAGVGPPAGEPGQ